MSLQVLSNPLVLASLRIAFCRDEMEEEEGEEEEEEEKPADDLVLNTDGDRAKNILLTRL